MLVTPEKISAWLDGELSLDEAAAVEDAVNADPVLQAEMESLIAANDFACAEFDAMLNDPVPDTLLAAIAAADPAAPSQAAASAAPPANQNRAPLGVWGLIAASLAILAVGGTGGWLLADQARAPVVVQAGWLQDIADYHRVYASQKRHLAEVPPEEADHIETWLTASIGVPVKIPDLRDRGLTFEGARLLVAAGKPVGQLLYTAEDGSVVALCMKGRGKDQEAEFAETEIDGFSLITWQTAATDYVFVGPADTTPLLPLAERIAGLV